MGNVIDLREYRESKLKITVDEETAPFVRWAYWQESPNVYEVEILYPNNVRRVHRVECDKEDLELTVIDLVDIELFCISEGL